ncbi:hypothetical protein [Methylovulum psychrotolerans]|jgi:hypothetical protein|uniref:Uncharacterized protein n=1 Tax=Methylovulum psychrotolerans TaxID=1704499 RepID=A0A1Z4C3H9_9GAMM|nr:hypothetical protein [Methylovulum psychrotolerans]ASF48091.1 hypothetical protein CEK71_19580 [Methylovulum psychrotolerans]MBT9100042.1 hypothetical protein [Methylovulum psychrotolerans]
MNNPFVGKWAYRSLLNDPNLNTAFNDLEFGQGVIDIHEDAMQILSGTIGGDGWSLKLQGSREYGSPMRVRFQGVGVVGGEQWIYDYEGYLVAHWPNGVQQIPALVGSVIRTIPHASSNGGISPAGVVASFYAVKL